MVAIVWGSSLIVTIVLGLLLVPAVRFTRDSEDLPMRLGGVTVVMSLFGLAPPAVVLLAKEWSAVASSGTSILLPGPLQVWFPVAVGVVVVLGLAVAHRRAAMQP